MKLTLRGHHLLCLKGFQGYGYDDKFTKNMTEVNLKRKEKDTAVLLTNTPDDICKACPNLKNNICENKKQNERIIKMDNAVLEKLDKKDEYSSNDLFKLIDEIFSSESSVSEICFQCKWQEKCLFYQKLLKNR